MNARTRSREVCGWCFSQSGKVCAYVMAENEPESAMMLPMPNWWTAMRFCLSLEHNNAAVRYIGGPSGE